MNLKIVQQLNEIAKYFEYTKIVYRGPHFGLSYEDIATPKIIALIITNEIESIISSYERVTCIEEYDVARLNNLYDLLDEMNNAFICKYKDSNNFEMFVLS